MHTAWPFLQWLILGARSIKVTWLNLAALFIKETELVNNGEIAAVIIDDEVLLKRYFYYPKENLLILQSENPKYQPKKYINEQLDHIRIVGKAIAFQSDVK